MVYHTRGRQTKIICRLYCNIISMACAVFNVPVVPCLIFVVVGCPVVRSYVQTLSINSPFYCGIKTSKNRLFVVPPFTNQMYLVTDIANSANVTSNNNNLYAIRLIALLINCSLNMVAVLVSTFHKINVPI